MSSTRLTAIAECRVFLQCRCGHEGMIHIADQMPRHSDKTLDELVRLLRCGACGRRGRIASLQIDCSL